MREHPRFPIRLKILVTLLFLVTGVVSLITFTMANLFHDDKKTYIHDLASLVAISTAEECDSVLTGYGERLRMYVRILLAPEISEEERQELLSGLFEDFPQLIAITLHDGEELLGSVYNSAALEEAGLTKQDLLDDEAVRRPAHGALEPGPILVANNTLAPDLPSLSVTVATVVADRERPIIASAVIRLDELLALTSRANGFEVSLVDAAGTLLADRDEAQVAARTAAVLQPEVKTVRNGFSSGLTLEYERDEEELIGAYAATDHGGVIVATQIPRSVAYLASRSLLRRLLVVASGLLATATGLGLVWAHRITRPVERLSDATREIGRGDFEIQVNVESRDEIGALAGSFNQMASELKHREIALQQSQAQLVQSGKMAAFGQLGAGIAHEVKNPLAGILGCAQISLRKADKDTLVFKNLQLIEKETRRCKVIIDNLLKFARQEKKTFDPTAINPVVEDTVAIVNHQLEMHKVQLETDYAADLPPALANANQLQQVVMNLMMNAQQAMDDQPGRIRVTTRRAGDGIEIEVRDEGPGVPPEIREKLFEPFFTTKLGGKGTGLGLSVSYGIVEEHGGKIRIDSPLEGGAAFVIELPIHVAQPEGAPALEEA